ncbi:hypothetical protein PV327_003278 [Microctonus hyperodae]|uniref:Uncharacterized protein n=1 Tax=Microctonus hyperodae TaxID=165561 RepID=A0AA39G4L7_MICHY|nr:hypothetical protein PV327_003278 [Microctonus hyperodae]
MYEDMEKLLNEYQQIVVENQRITTLIMIRDLERNLGDISSELSEFDYELAGTQTRLKSRMTVLLSKFWENLSKEPDEATYLALQKKYDEIEEASCQPFHPELQLKLDNLRMRWIPQATQSVMPYLDYLNTQMMN